MSDITINNRDNNSSPSFTANTSLSAELTVTNANVKLTNDDVLLTHADVVTTNADVVTTNNNVVLTNADVATTNSDVILVEADKVQTGLDRIQTGLDLVATNQDTIDTAADRVQTGLDRIAVAADLVQTNQDTIDTASDLALTNADVVLTHADVVSTNQDTIDTEADRVQTGLDRVATGNDKTATNADVVLTHADVALTHADVILAEADKVQTGLDRIATNADVVTTHADVVLTNADVVLTHADVVSTSSNSSTATTQAGIATTKASEAAASAAQALVSQVAAELAETHAETAETNAELAETHAETAEAASLASQAAALASQNSATASANSATASASSATASAASASSSATDAQSSEDDAEVSQIAAANSATSASGSASAASSSASAASSSASTATTQASNASGSATSASNSASSASVSASTATTQAGIATTKASEAAASATNAASTLTTFDTQYVSQATEPTSPVEGMLWFDETDNQMKVYDGSLWGLAGSSISGVNNSVEYTATAGQTTFIATYDIGYIDVYLNGVLLAKEDYTATDGANVVLDSGASVNDIVFVQSFGTFELANVYTKSAQDITDAAQDVQIALKANQSTTYTKTEVDNKPSGFKNLIINGGFDVWQRGVSFVDPVSSYTADRWTITGGNDNTVSRVIVPENNGYGVHITSATDNNFIFGTKLEDVSRFSNKTITFSYKAKSATATNLRAIAYYYDTAGSLITYATIGTDLAIPSTLTQFNKTLTVPDLSASSIKGNSSYMFVRFDNASIQDVDVTITEIQLEEGSVATPFEQRPYGLELSLCQRYYETIPAQNIIVHADTSNSIVHASCHKFAIEKRVDPTFNTCSVGHINGGANYYNQSISGNKTVITRIGYGTSYSSPGSWIYWNTSTITVDAEL